MITSADGPRSEFCYDGKTLMAFEPASNLVAVAGAPPTIDGALKTAHDVGATYFPFTDVIVADPYADIAEDLKLAFYIGQSEVVGGTTTDMSGSAGTARARRGGCRRGTRRGRSSRRGHGGSRAAPARSPARRSGRILRYQKKPFMLPTAAVS